MQAITTSTPEQQHVPVQLARVTFLSVAAPQSTQRVVTHRQSRVSIVTLHRTALLAAAAAEYRCNAPHCSFSPSASIPSCTMHVKQWMMCSTHIRCYTHIRLRLQHKHEIAYGVTAVHSSTLLSSKLSANANAQKKTHRHKYRLASEER